MNFATLSGEGVWNPGADFWIAPQPSEFAHFDQIDWYLNLLLSKSLSHQLQEPSIEILEILKRTSQTFNRQTLESTAPHLYMVHLFLPTKYFVLLNYENGKLNDWLNKIEALAKQLKVSTIRIFLPESNKTELRQSSFKNEFYKDVSLVAATGQRS